MTASRGGCKEPRGGRAGYRGGMWDWTSAWLSDAGYVAAMVLLLLVNAVGVFLVALQLPGTWVMLLTTMAAAWWAKWQWGGDWWSGPITIWTLVVLLALAILGEVLEFLAGAAGASKAGASKRGVVGAIVGGVLGALVGTVAIPIPIVGTLIGAAIGSGVGSILGDKWAGREWRPAMIAGRGAAIGRFWGAVLKLAVAVVMWGVVAVAVVWP